MDQEYDCAYCPLGGVGEPVMLDGHPAHPDCADGARGSNLAGIRALVSQAIVSPFVRRALAGALPGKDLTNA